jgi:hypothetical protein
MRINIGARQVCKSDRNVEADSPLFSIPKKSHFFRPVARDLIALSAGLLSNREDACLV